MAKRTDLASARSLEIPRSVRPPEIHRGFLAAHRSGNRSRPIAGTLDFQIPRLRNQRIGGDQNFVVEAILPAGDNKSKPINVIGTKAIRSSLDLSVISLPLRRKLIWSCQVTGNRRRATQLMPRLGKIRLRHESGDHDPGVHDGDFFVKFTGPLQEGNPHRLKLTHRYSHAVTVPVYDPNCNSSIENQTP